jgi:predicted MFS family arabinose efflux permease
MSHRGARSFLSTFRSRSSHFSLAISIYAISKKRETHLDWQGVIFGFVGLGGVSFSLIEGPQLGWNALTISALVGGITLLLLFIRWEGRIKYPQVDLSLFRNKIFSATNAATFLLYGAFSGFGLVFAVFLQTIGQYSSAMTGAAFIPSSILLILFSSKIGGLSKKWGARWFMTVGPIVCGLGMLFLLPLGPHPSYISNLLPGIMLFGIGLTIVVAPLTATALNSAPESKSGLASAINNGVASVGPLIAVALIGIFGADHAYSFTTILCATLAILSGLVSFAYVRP